MPAEPRPSSKPFVSLLAVELLGAANIGAVAAVTLHVLRSRASLPGGSLAVSLLALALIPLAFVLASPVAGGLADRYPKDRVLRSSLLLALPAAALAAWALASRDPVPALAALFLMALQWAGSSPARYGLLAELLPQQRLSLGNGLLQATTGLGLVAGALGGAELCRRRFDGSPAAGWVFVGVALTAVACSIWARQDTVPRDGARTERNAAGAWRYWWRETRKDPVLLQSISGIVWFGLIGAFVSVCVLGSTNGLPRLLVAAGVGASSGSLLAGVLSRGRVEPGLVPLGSLGTAAFTLDLAWAWPETGAPGALSLRAVVDLALLGASAGMFVLPLKALLQRRSPQQGRGRMIAGTNRLAAIAALVGIGLVGLAVDVLGWGWRALLVGAGVAQAAATIYIVSLLPQFLVRLVLWLLTNTLWRIEVVGEHNVPRTGGLLVANHVSWVDALLIAAASERVVRFLMFRPFYEWKPLHWFFRRMEMIPVSAKDPPQLKEASLDHARDEIANGHLVCIFAEGAITRTGNLLRFRRGFERIAEGTETSIVPVLLDGVWGSLLSYERGRLLFKRPRGFRAPVRVFFGEPMPARSRTFEVRQRIQELSVEAVRGRRSRQLPLFRVFLRRARRAWRSALVIESGGTRLRAGQALVRSVLLARRLLRDGRGGEPVTVVLPVGSAATLANLAALAAGRPVSNLDPRESWPELQRRIETAGSSIVLSSRRQWARARASDEPRTSWERLGRLARLIDVETTLEAVPFAARARAWLACRLLPAAALTRWMVPVAARDPDEPAAHAAAPGGGDAPPRVAVLSNRNLLVNIQAVRQVFMLSPDDRILGVLPLANPFGLTHTLLLPAVAGVPVVCHPDPDDVEGILRAAREHRVSLFPVPPELLPALCSAAGDGWPELRHVLTSDRGVTPALREKVSAVLGVELLVGFGCPECSPLISLNVPLLVTGRHGQRGAAPGTSGHPLPGVAVRIVERGTDRELPPEQDGILQVKGANVMLGYLDDARATRAVLHDGWFVSPYPARQDADGFLTILDPTPPTPL